MLVLVIDDDRDNAEMLGEIVSLQGHEVALAFDGESAIASALELVPQIVLLDIGLPDIDGYEVARRLREQAVLAGMVLIALTGYSGPEHERQSQQAGFDHYLVKPFRFDDLQQLLRS